MGGLGSGRWPRESGRQTTDDLPALDVRELKRRGLVELYQEELGDIAHLEWTPCNFGGSRPWFLCSGEECVRRAAILYCADDDLWLCRSCCDLVYASQREDRLGRARRRAEKARRRLAPDNNNPRPKGMHNRTFVRLGREYVKAYEEHVARYEEKMAKLSEQYARRRPGVPPS